MPIGNYCHVCFSLTKVKIESELYLRSTQMGSKDRTQSLINDFSIEEFF